jgi:hypothetical protein
MTGNRHATTEELLALRDGEGSAWARAHLGACPACAGELYHLEQMRARLRALPGFTSPRDRWPAVAQVARAERRRRRVFGAAGLAVAASLAALTFAALRPSSTAEVAQRAALERAMANSAAVEEMLKSLEPERRALPGDAAGAAAYLEDRLRSIDAALGEPGAWREAPNRVLDLWQERAGVLSALVDVHTARAALAGL